jgi:antitoxin MazE
MRICIEPPLPFKGYSKQEAPKYSVPLALRLGAIGQKPYSESVLIQNLTFGGTSVARRTISGEYSYSRTAQIRGREQEGRYAVIQKDRNQTRVARRRLDGSAIGAGELVPTADVFDLKPTHVVPTGQRGTITLPGELRRNLGIEEGTPLELIQEEDGRISIRPLSLISTPALTATLNDLLDGITPENLHDEVSTGEAVGREFW